MENTIDYLVDQPITAKAVQDIVGHPVNWYTYGNIKKFKTLDELLGRRGAAFLLYELRPRVGHWVAIFKVKPDEVEFFDPLGFLPDHALTFIDKKNRVNLKQTDPHLIDLMINSPYKLSYNQYKFQKPEAATCGRWVGMRLRHKDMSLNDFAKIYKVKHADKNITEITHQGTGV